ncbi:MAG: OmpA family protein [Gammaproteobacteria bacterium]|nr:OmpA family protein [Gammaproteobacteria bacterium]
MSRSTAILVGIASLLLLTWITVATRHDAIENDLAERVGQALAAHAISGLEIAPDGRDVRLSGELPRRFAPDYVAGIAADVWGVRSVDADAVVRRASMLDANDPLNARFDTRRIVRLGGDLSNPMDAGSCQRTMARLASVSAIRFESGGASPMIESYPVLNDLAAVAFQCPATRLVIGGHTDGSGDREFNLRLSQARAEAVERFFYLAGIDPRRMQIIAYGDSQPIASNATPEGRAANRRITFDVLPIQ